MKRALHLIMMIAFAIILLPETAHAEAVAINETTFPDENFRTYVSTNCDTNHDGSLSNEEIAAVTRIDVSGSDKENDEKIADLTGVKYFTTLWHLSCDDNMLASLDVSGCTALLELRCDNNKLTSLDISGCTTLGMLNCSGNQLTSLDVSGCTALLSQLICDNNKLTSLDVSGCTMLGRLICSGNQLTSLDVSDYTALVELKCDNNKLTSLDVSGCTALQELWCFNNQLTSLDVSSCTALASLECEGNQFTLLDLRNNHGINSNMHNGPFLALRVDDNVRILYADGTVREPIVRETTEQPTTSQPAPAPLEKPTHAKVVNWKVTNGKVIATDATGNIIRQTGVVEWNGYKVLVANGVFYKNPKPMLFQDKVDGKWKYFVNGVQVHGGDTFVYQYGKLWHVTNGELNLKDGFVKYNGQLVFAYKGSAATFYTGWIRYAGYKCYLQKGVLKKYTR